jgi:uncharacterized protein (TIGR02246 family)
MDSAIDELKQRIAILEDREEIRDLIERYAEAADRQNEPAMMNELFTEDAIWEAAGFGRFEGRAAITAGLAEIATNRLIWTMHYMISPRIRVTDDRATAQASWRVWELATVPGGLSAPAEAVWGGGTYHVDLARISGSWRFRHVRLQLELISRYADGWARTRLAQV